MILTIEEILFSYRTVRNKTLDDLEKQTGYTAGYLGKIERGDLGATFKFIRNISISLEIPLYNLLVAYNGRSADRSLRVGTDGRELPEKDMLALLESSQYSISALFRFHQETKDKPGSLTELCVETSIPEERLEEIRTSFNREYKVSLSDALRICSVLNKKFHDLFAITCKDFMDKNTVNIAFTVENYVEKHRTKVIRFNEIDDKLSEDEIAYLKKVLTVYRTLRLKPHA